MEAFWAFSWILIPIVAILVGGFTEWLKFREKTARLGDSTHELEKTVEALQAALDARAEREEALVERVQNLEAIVTSQTWDALHDDALPEAERARALSEARLRLDGLGEPSDAERAAQLARRLQV